MARDRKQLLILSYLTCCHSGLRALPQMAKSELISGGSWCQQVGKKMPNKTTAQVDLDAPGPTALQHGAGQWRAVLA